MCQKIKKEILEDLLTMTFDPLSTDMPKELCGRLANLAMGDFVGLAKDFQKRAETEPGLTAEYLGLALGTCQLASNIGIYQEQVGEVYKEILPLYLKERSNNKQVQY